MLLLVLQKLFWKIDSSFLRELKNSSSRSLHFYLAKHYYLNEKKDYYQDNFHDILALHSIGDYTRVFPEILQSIKLTSLKQQDYLQDLEDYYLNLNENIKIIKTYYNYYFPKFIKDHILCVFGDKENIQHDVESSNDHEIITKFQEHGYPKLFHLSVNNTNNEMFIKLDQHIKDIVQLVNSKASHPDAYDMMITK